MDNGADAGAGGRKQQQEEHGQQQQQQGPGERQQRNHPQRGGCGRGRGSRGGRHGRGERGGKGKGRRGGEGRGRGGGRGGSRAGRGIDHGGGVYSKPGRKGPRVRGSHVGPGTFGCGRLGLLFTAFRFLRRQTFRRGRHHNEREPKGQQGHQTNHGQQHSTQQGLHHGNANSQPPLEQARPYVTSNGDAGEAKVS